MTLHQRRGHRLRVRCAAAIVPLLGILMLVPLQAVCVEGAGMELAVPRDPKCIRRLDEPGQIPHPPSHNSGAGVHVERTVDDVPRVAGVRRRSEHVLAEQRCIMG